MRRIFVLLLLLLGLQLHAADKGVQHMVEKIHWLGHDGFRIAAKSVIYLDPFQIKDGQTADIILVTHAHHDHCSPADIGKIAGPRTVIVGPADSLVNLRGDTRAIAPGGRMKIGEVEIVAVPAYNINKPYHPKKNGWVGYLVTVDGVTVYHAGDTDHIPEMKNIRADIALLPVGGTYTMTADEAARAALDVHPAVAIPMHYGTIVGKPEDAERFRRLLQKKVNVVIKAKE